jgi:Alw26I/Eco31I/Esp3I family type II restriction m6 adenine DNA methyltransferase
MTLNLKRSRQYLQEFDFRSLFIEELGWSIPASQKVTAFEVEGLVFNRVAIAELAGVIVLEITAEVGQIPDSKLRSKIHQVISQIYAENLLIFLDQERRQSLWYWVKRDGNKLYRRDHLFVKGQTGDLFLSKLGGLVVDITEFEQNQVSVISAARKLKEAFDIERVTKQFYKDFKDLHINFVDFLQDSIENENDRRWYGSVLLNRLMFVYFLQGKYFLNKGDGKYLQNKLAESQASGENQFYSFLCTLFFDGFAKPEGLRDTDIKQKIGQICYLNGGLFLKHPIEEKYPQIAISDRAFEQVLSLFGRYSWNLDDTPEGKDDEINPDVLGYIFEKYINQKEFGAYYTRPEITEYLCDRTINKLVADRLGIENTGLNDLLLQLNGAQCTQLLTEILPNLTLLDPACGSGAFLVAAMKTLINIYSAVVGQAKQFLDSSEVKEKLTQWFTEANTHPSLDYYIKKRIITDNLYGVDIMEEATEIAKLRLFLALVASAKTVKELEPLPNIDFNIMAGNSLIGLIRVDSNAFDQLSTKKVKQTGGVAVQKHLFQAVAVQGSLLPMLASSEYDRILQEKNQSIALYKQHAFELGAIQGTAQEDRLLFLRKHIEQLNQESQQKLNQILLDEFSQKLGIKYEEAQPIGKPKKRVLNITDINNLEPFHWGYHFDSVFAKGGFDAIITNPPWEIFKPQAKEFFAQHSDLVQKKKMDIKEFEKKQKELLKNSDIAQAWCEYQSKFPYVSSYYRSAEQYHNQISIVNGKKAGTDINLYKLFVEQCFNLLRSTGECGIVIPSGIYTDLGTKQLREMLFQQTEITGLFCFENRKEIFEGVHRSFKFVVLTFQKEKQTQSFPAAFMRLEVKELTNFPNEDSLNIDLDLVRKLSPDSLSIMEFKNKMDIEIAEKMLKFPLLGEKIEGKWNLKLTREFDMTNDSHLFKTESANGQIPLYEGKMIHQFTHQFAEPRYWVDEKEGRESLLGKKQVDQGQKLDYQAYRLGFRSAGENTNIRNLIATVLPKNIFCGNSILVSKDLEDNDNTIMLILGLLNSFIVDYAVRLKISRNMNMFYVYQLPVPRLQKGDQWFDAIVQRAAKLICTTPEFDDLAQEMGLESHKNGVINEVQRGQLRAELDGIIAHLYRLTEQEFAYILTTFPIVADPIKQNALNAYRDVKTGLIK